MNVLNKKKIKKCDWNSFRIWSKKESFLFGDENFFSGFISLNFNKIEKYLIDFFIYNHYVLEDRYYFEWPNWLKKIKGNTIEEFITNLFKSRFPIENEYKVFSLLENVLWELREYLILDIIDKDVEYEILEKYWIFIKALRKLEYKNHNIWIIYINERIHKKTKGFK